jgi:hypothetical protein
MILYYDAHFNKCFLLAQVFYKCQPMYLQSGAYSAGFMTCRSTLLTIADLEADCCQPTGRMSVAETSAEAVAVVDDRDDVSRRRPYTGAVRRLVSSLIARRAVP